MNAFMACDLTYLCFGVSVMTGLTYYSFGGDAFGLTYVVSEGETTMLNPPPCVNMFFMEFVTYGLTKVVVHVGVNCCAFEGENIFLYINIVMVNIGVGSCAWR